MIDQQRKSFWDYHLARAEAFAEKFRQGVKHAEENKRKRQAEEKAARTGISLRPDVEENKRKRQAEEKATRTGISLRPDDKEDETS